MNMCSLMLLAIAVVISLSLAASASGAPTPSKLTLSFRQAPRDSHSGRLTPKLDIDHADIGPVCELQCYETGPFQSGEAVKNPDGSIVFRYQSGNMTCTTTFTTVGDSRVASLTEVKGPVDELRKIRFIGSCLQFQRSPIFTRQHTLQEFGSRCLLYTMRGPVMGLDTARGKSTNFRPEAPENNPPLVQWHVAVDRMHPGNHWGAVGAAGDRPLYSLVGCTSSDGQWLTGYGAFATLSLGQLFMPCIHVVTDVQAHLDEAAARIRYKEMIYVLPNDPQRLLQAYLADFPAASKERTFTVSAEQGGTLRLSPTAPGLQPLTLSVEAQTAEKPAAQPDAAAWSEAYWGAFIRSGGSWRLWAHPWADSLELCASFAEGEWTPEEARAAARFSGSGWVASAAPEGVPAQVLRSADGAWTAALFWERSAAGQPALGLALESDPAARSLSVRGRALLYQGTPELLAGRWQWAAADWKHATPYRMPAPGGPVDEARLLKYSRPPIYGLTVAAPWKDGGSLTINLPEHLEISHGGPGILRNTDKAPAGHWQAAEDGRSALFDVESTTIPGARVRATAKVAAPHRIELALRITNDSQQTMPAIRPLFCLQYRQLTGFPQWQDNFRHTYVFVDGRMVALSDLATQSPDARVKGAAVRGMPQPRSAFVDQHGGAIEKGVDAAIIAVTSLDGKKKVITAWTPGQTMLSNANIPCIHGDPYFGEIRPGQSVEVSGVVLFTEEPLEEAMRKLLKAGEGVPAARPGAAAK